MSQVPPPSGTAPPPRRILVLLNPVAGRGGVEKVRDAVRSALDGSGATLDFVEVGPAREARSVTAEAGSRGYDLVLVAGGDGTVAHAAAGLVGTTVPLGIVPTGTGNIVATNLGIPMAPREAARAAFLGTPVACDVGRTDDGRIFLLAAGAGYDADLIRDADRELKRRFGPLAYLFAMFKNLRVRRARYTVEMDHAYRVHVHAKTVLVCNVGRTMGKLPLVADARIDDGLLHVVVFTFAGFGQLLVLFFKALAGRLRGTPGVQFFKARHVRILASRPMPVQVDGTFIDRTTPLEMSVIPGALTLVRPPARPVLDLAGLAENALRAIKEIPARLAEETQQDPAPESAPDHETTVQ